MTRLTNPLLVKAQVGKPKASVFSLPPSNHVYGKPSEPKVVKEANRKLMHNSAQRRISYPPQVDYLALNKKSLKAGIKSPKGQNEFRKHNVVYKDDVITGRRDRSKVLPSDNNPQFTYGKPTRPSTPLGKLLSDAFQKEAAATKKPKATKEKKIKHYVVKVKTQSEPEKPKERFILSKFKNVSNKVDTRRQVAT